MPAARPRFGARRRRHLIGALLILTLAVGVQTAAAAPNLYWTNYNSVGRADLGGTNADQNFIPGLTYPRGIAVNDDFIYWSNNGTSQIGRARRDGTGVQMGFITGVNGPSGLAADASHIYWVNTGDGTIGRADLDGTNVDQSFIATGRFSVGGLALDGAHLYWTESNTQKIGRAALDGTAVNLSFITTGSGPSGVAVDAGHVYWANYVGSVASIGRAALDGTGATQSFIPLTGYATYVASDGTHLYWGEYQTNRVGRANVDGTNANEDFITGAPGPTGVVAILTDPAAGLSPATGAFADRQEGTTSSGQGFTVTNTGTGRLTLGAAAIGGADPSQFSISSDTCSGQGVAAGGTCTLHVTFGPSSPGAKTASITVPNNGSLSPVTAGLSGTATAAPAVIPPATPTPTPAPAPQIAPRAGQSPTALGIAGVNVAVSGPGTLTSTARGTVGSAKVRIPADEVAVTAPGTVRVRLVLPPRVRARLAATGRVPLRVTSVFAGDDGSLVTSTLVTILRAPPSRGLPGQWIGRVLGPWASMPTMGARVRSALRFTVDDPRRLARVVR